MSPFNDVMALRCLSSRKAPWVPLSQRISCSEDLVLLRQEEGRSLEVDEVALVFEEILSGRDPVLAAECLLEGLRVGLPQLGDSIVGRAHAPGRAKIVVEFGAEGVALHIAVGAERLRVSADPWAVLLEPVAMELGFGDVGALPDAVDEFDHGREGRASRSRAA